MKTLRTILVLITVNCLLMTNVATAQAFHPIPSGSHSAVDGRMASVAFPDAPSGNLPCGTDSALVGCWQMEENGGSILEDGSSYANDATLYGAPAWAPGIGGGYAIDLNGTSQYALVPDNSSLDISDQITILAWIRPEQYATQDLIKKATQGSINGYELSLATTKSDATSQRAFFRINQVTSGDTYRINATTMYPIDGTWMHVAATYDGSTMRLYINGVEESNLTLPAGTKIALNNVPLSIGAQSTPSRYYKGWMDDARIFNRALSPEEIEAFINFPPVAVDDTYDTPEDTLLDVPAPGVLTNDTDADLDPLTAIKVTDPAHGILTLNEDGSFTYDPEEDWNGSDSFTYKANDAQIDSNTATVTIQVTEVDDPPEVTDPGAQSSAEGDVISLQIDATDVDSPTPHYSATNLPYGLSIDPDTGLISGSITYHAAAGSPYSPSVTVTDGTTPVTVYFTWTVSETAFGPCTGASGLLACYQMEEGSGSAIYDGSSAGNDGTTTGTPLWLAGKTGAYALSLNGTSQYALVPDDDSLDVSSAITLAAWVKPGQKATQNVLKKTIGTTTTNGYELSLSSAGYVFIRLNGNVAYRVDSLTPYPTDGNTWMHIAATYDGTTLKVYINGALDNSKAATTTIAANTTNLGIGAEPATTPINFFKGSIDDARIYNRALTLEEIQELAWLRPVVTDIPDQTIFEGASFATINLDDYVSDPDNTDAEMTWTWSGNTALSVAIVDRVATITTPDSDWNGAETITFRATDPGGHWDEDAAIFTVSGVNDPPVLDLIGPKVIDELASLTFTGTATDIDLPGDTLTYSLEDGDDGSVPEGAGIGSTSGDFSWTPTEAQGPGSYTFDVCVYDGTTSDCETITVSVNEVASSPTAVADQYCVLQNHTLMVVAPGVLANDSDTDIPPSTLTASLVTDVTHGELNLTASGFFVYVPSYMWTGVDTFTYKVFDGTSFSGTVTVTIRVRKAKTYLPLLILPIDPPVPGLIQDPLSDTYTLSWDPVGGANDYMIWESLSTTFPTDPTYVTGGSASFALPAKNPTRYYYYVIATDGSRRSLPSNVLTVDRQYELEDNDSGASANGPILPGITYYGKPDDEKDFFKFYAETPPASITISLNNLAPVWEGQLQLYINNPIPGNLVAWDYSRPLQINCTPTGCTPENGPQTITAGWYYIYIATVAGTESDQRYELTITITY